MWENCLKESSKVSGSNRIFSLARNLARKRLNVCGLVAHVDTGFIQSIILFGSRHKSSWRFLTETSSVECEDLFPVVAFKLVSHILLSHLRLRFSRLICHLGICNPDFSPCVLISPDIPLRGACVLYKFILRSFLSPKSASLKVTLSFSYNAEIAGQLHVDGITWSALCCSRYWRVDYFSCLCLWSV